MADYDNTDKGIAYPNDYKKEDKHPHFKGKGNYFGKDFEFGVWKRRKIDEKGKEFVYLTFAFSEPYVKPDGKAVVSDTSRVNEDEQINLDDIPF